MAYDDQLADRVRQALGPRPDVTERRMFGGVCFLLDGKMLCGVATAALMVRVGPEAHAAALARPHARPMDFTGRPMVGFVYVDPAGVRTVKAIAPWLERAMAYVATVKRATRKPARPRPRRVSGPRSARAAGSERRARAPARRG